MPPDEVLVNPGGCVRAEEVAVVACDVARLFQLLVVEEEERLVSPVQDSWNDDRTPESSTELVLFQRGLRDVVPIVEPGVGVQRIAPIVLVHAARQRVGSGPRDELDLRRALRAFRTLRRRRHRDFLDGVETWTDDSEEAVGRTECVVLDVHAVEGDVDHALRQTVDHRLAVAAWRLYARQERHEIHRAARRQRKFQNLIGIDRRRYRRRLRLDDLRR